MVLRGWEDLEGVCTTEVVEPVEDVGDGVNRSGEIAVVGVVVLTAVRRTGIDGRKPEDGPAPPVGRAGRLPSANRVVCRIYVAVTAHIRTSSCDERRQSSTSETP
jgi:hypothetical protein